MALKHKGISDLDFKERLQIYAAARHTFRTAILKELKVKSLTFADMKERFAPINPNTLAYHLKRLKEAKLIDDELETREGSTRHKGYYLTAYGVELFKVEDLTTLL